MPTHGSRVLDVLVTDKSSGYDKAIILHPIKPDVPGHGHASDHAVVVAKPNLDKSKQTGFSCVVKRARRLLSVKNLIALTFYLGSLNWHPLYDAVGVDAQLDVFEAITHQAQDTFCPLEHYQVKINSKFHRTIKTNSIRDNLKPVLLLLGLIRQA